MIIYYLNPIFILIKDNLYNWILRLVLFISLDFKLAKFITQETAETLSFLGYSIYLEIIQLRFFGLDEDLKNNIIKRGNRETFNINTIYEEEDRDFYESFENENPDNNLEI